MCELITRPQADAIESVVAQGDLSKLSPQDRVSYYQSVCRSLGLNPLTRPFEYIVLNGKLTLYARKDATDQLRKLNGISISKPDIDYQDDWIVVTISARDNTGREDSDVGVVKKTDMRGDFGNAIMKAITKAKRRVTLSICGLGWSDETEVETIPTAKPIQVDVETGEIKQIAAEIVEPAVTPEQAPAAAPEAPQEQKTESTGAPWTKDAKAMTRVRNFAFGGNALNESDVHEALGGRMHDYPGTEQEAIKAIAAYVARKAAP